RGGGALEVLHRRGEVVELLFALVGAGAVQCLEGGACLFVVAFGDQELFLGGRACGGGFGAGLGRRTQRPDSGVHHTETGGDLVDGGAGLLADVLRIHLDELLRRVVGGREGFEGALDLLDRGERAG